MDARPDGARRAHAVEAGVLDHGQRAGDLVVRAGHVVHRRRVADGDDGAVHAERLEEAPHQQLLPTLAGGSRRHLAGRHVEDVLVDEAVAHRVGGLDGGHLLEDLAPGAVGSIPEQVDVAEAGAVGEEIAYGQLPARPRVRELEPGELLLDAVVPSEPSGIDLEGDRGGRHGLGRRADREERVGIDGLLAAQLAHAVAALEDGLAVLDDGDRQTGDLPGIDRGGRIGIELGRRVGRARRRDASGEEGEQSECEPHRRPP
ncbi:MAG: hypothetical protein R2991_01875 [Thermoanaerobaculia bacterium]